MMEQIINILYAVTPVLIITVGILIVALLGRYVLHLIKTRQL
jgi:hypothetical protein